MRSCVSSPIQPETHDCMDVPYDAPKFSELHYLPLSTSRTLAAMSSKENGF